MSIFNRDDYPLRKRRLLGGGPGAVLNDTAAHWAEVNPVLKNGRQGHETDTGILKVGDGVTPWDELEAVGGSGGGGGGSGSTIEIPSSSTLLTSYESVHFIPSDTYVEDGTFDAVLSTPPGNGVVNVNDGTATWGVSGVFSIMMTLNSGEVTALPSPINIMSINVASGDIPIGPTVFWHESMDLELATNSIAADLGQAIVYAVEGEALSLQIVNSPRLVADYLQIACTVLPLFTVS